MRDLLAEELANRRKELEEERSVKIGGIVTTLDNIGNVYAKLYSSSDGDVLELSSDENYVDKTEGLILKQDYGNIANDHYNHYNHEWNYVQEYDEENNFYTVIKEEVGFFPPWIEKIENEYSAESYYYKESYYDMNYTIKKAKIVDDIELLNASCLFANLSEIMQIEGLNKLDTKQVTDMSYMFSNCKGLTNLDLSNFKTENVTDMSGMFYDCKSLTNLDVSKFNTKNSSGKESVLKIISPEETNYTIVSLIIKLSPTLNVLSFPNEHFDIFKYIIPKVKKHGLRFPN